MSTETLKKIYFKTIIQGRLEFGSIKSYKKIIKLYDKRAEEYHKNDIIFTSEEIFDEDKLTIEIPRFVGQVSEKRFKNTVALLSYSSQFAITGSIRAWMSEEGKVMHYSLMEPESDKVAVRSYLKGRSLVKKDGQEEEAIQALNKAIEKYDRHAQAYERRAKVVFRLKNYHDAKRDYTKCINIDPTIPTAYYGRAKCFMLEENWNKAIEDFNQTLKKSVALQTVYWKARRLKAKCHIKLKEYDKAQFDLKLYGLRNFDPTDINHFYKAWSFFTSAELDAIEQKPIDAIPKYTTAIEIIEKKGKQLDVNLGNIYRLRSIAKKSAGKSTHLKDLRRAAELGDNIALKLLSKKK